MAARIPAVGRVTVSLRRSIDDAGPLKSVAGRQGLGAFASELNFFNASVPWQPTDSPHT